MKTQEGAIGLREDILELALSLFYRLQAAEGWTEPPRDVEEIMDEIFRLVTLALKIKE